VTAVGDLLGPTISGLERLLQIPTGCGEQNMITLAPNVYVAKYLLATAKMKPDLRQRVVNNMVVGYGRQLTYRH
ncbi:CD109, partial [Symbiodinium pilosum]